MQVTQTPSHAAALHRAEIDLSLNLDSAVTPKPAQLSQLLRSLALLHAEAQLLLAHNHPPQHPHPDPVADARLLPRLRHLLRAIHPCVQYLVHIPLHPPNHPQLAASAARVVAVFVHLQVDNGDDLVRALSNFLVYAKRNQWPSVTRDVAVDVLPALHLLLEDAQPSFYAAAVSALQPLVDFAVLLVRCVDDPTVCTCQQQRDAFHSLLHIAVAIVVLAVDFDPSHASLLRDNLLRLRNSLSTTLPSHHLDARLVFRDLNHLTSMQTSAKP